MFDWLQKYTGERIYGENVESSELENLKKQLKFYKKKYEKEDKEMEILSDKEEEISPEDQLKIDEDMKRRQQKKKEMRNAISNQVFGKLNKEQYQIKKFEKTEIQKKKIKEKLLSIFLFNSLNEKELNDIINAFEEKKYKLNEIVFKQGENSENFYLVEQGEFDCEKIFRIGDPETYIKSFRAGDHFEELSLLYNYKNPYSIKAKNENCSLYSLNREIYNNIIRNFEYKKREKYMKILKQIEILSTLNDSELLKIIDNLTFEIVKEGNKIIKQNENGNKMLIIDEGEAQAIKNIDGKPDQKLNVYNKDSYFCENCLLKNEINPFNIIANKDCNVAIIDRMTFKRLVGPLENLLERDRKIYQKFMK